MTTGQDTIQNELTGTQPLEFTDHTHLTLCAKGAKIKRLGKD